MLSNIQPQEDILQKFKIPLNKIKKVLLLSESIIIVIQNSNQYTVYKLPLLQVQSIGKFPPLSEKFMVYSFNLITFMQNNSVFVLEWQTGITKLLIQIPISYVYHERFFYFIRKYRNLGEVLLIWKNSILLNNNSNVGYEAIIYRLHYNPVNNGDILPEKIKSHRLNLNSFYKLQYLNQQLVIIRLKGYKIDVQFIDSGITHQINSIYKLFLIETRIQQSLEDQGEELVLVFLKQEYSDQLLRFRVTKNKYRKEYTNRCHTPKNLFIFNNLENIYPLQNHQSVDEEYSRRMKNLYKNPQFRNSTIIEFQLQQKNSSKEERMLTIRMHMSLKLKFTFLMYHLNKKKFFDQICILLEKGFMNHQNIETQEIIQQSECQEKNKEQGMEQKYSFPSQIKLSKYKVIQNQYEISENFLEMILSLL